MDVISWILPYFLINHAWKDADELVIFYGGAKVEVFGFYSDVTGSFVGIGDGAVYMYFYIEH